MQAKTATVTTPRKLTIKMITITAVEPPAKGFFETDESFESVQCGAFVAGIVG